jgi:hypothetical protein
MSLKLVRTIIRDSVHANQKGKTFVRNRYLKPDIVCVVFCESAFAVQRKHDAAAAVIRRHRLASRNTRCRTVLAFMPIPMSQIPVDLLTRGNMNEPFEYLPSQVMHESNPTTTITIAEKKNNESRTEVFWYRNLFRDVTINNPFNRFA